MRTTGGGYSVEIAAGDEREAAMRVGAVLTIEVMQVGVDAGPTRKGQLEHRAVVEGAVLNGGACPEPVLLNSTTAPS